MVYILYKSDIVRFPQYKIERSAGMPAPKEGIHVATEAEIEALFKKRGLSHFIGMLNPPRPGVQDSLMTLEERHYAPGTERNELFTLVLLTWQDIDWVIASIPSTDYALMKSAAQAHGLCIVRGKPMILTGSGTHTFPIEARRMYTFENTPNHPVYRIR